MIKNLLRNLLLFVAIVCSGTAMAEDPDIVILEDFNAFDGGTQDEPLTTDISGYGGKLRTVLGWNSSLKIYEAGGTLMVGEGGYLRTSNKNLSTNGGNVQIKVKVKMRDAYGGGVKFTMGFTAIDTKYVADDEWHTYTVVAPGGSSSTFIRIEPQLSASGILVDDLEVSTSDSFVAAPKTVLPSDATKVSFSATWYGVTGNTGYLLDVYSYNDENEKDFFLYNQEVTGSYTSQYSTNKYKVTGLDETKTYYYRMRTVRGEHMSDYSDEIRVVPVITKIDAPTMSDPTDVTETGFTVSWSAVENAKGYRVKVVRKEVLTEEGEVKMLDEDFSGVTVGTITSPEYPTGTSLDAYTIMPGWTATQHALAAGYMGISPYSGTGTISTPKLDLSASEGKYKVKIKLGISNYGTFVAGECKVTSYDKDGEEVKVWSLTLEDEMKEYEYEFTGGDEETQIVISYMGDKKLYVDEMSVSQVLPAGAVKTDVLSISDEDDKLSISYAMPLSETVSYEVSVAARGETVQSGEIVDIYSEYSTPVVIALPSGVNDIATDVEEDANAPIFNLQGIRIENPVKGQIYVKKGKKFMLN